MWAPPWCSELGSVGLGTCRALCPAGFILGPPCAGRPQGAGNKPRDPLQGSKHILSLQDSSSGRDPAWVGPCTLSCVWQSPVTLPAPQELFKKVVPYHCLGSIWSQRDKKGKEHLAPTVRATVTQFNSVANCVITTCLGDRTVTARDRARVVEHWIEVARVCLQGVWGTPFPSFPLPGCGLWSEPLWRPQALLLWGLGTYFFV